MVRKHARVPSYPRGWPREAGRLALRPRRWSPFATPLPRASQWYQGREATSAGSVGAQQSCEVVRFLMRARPREAKAGGQGQVQVGTRSASKSRAGPLASGSFAGSPSGRPETRHLWPECRLLLEMLRTLVFPTFEVFCFWKMLFQKEMIPRAELASPVGWGL